MHLTATRALRTGSSTTLCPQRLCSLHHHHQQQRRSCMDVPSPTAREGPRDTKANAFASAGGSFGLSGSAGAAAAAPAGPSSDALAGDSQLPAEAGESDDAAPLRFKGTGPIRAKRTAVPGVCGGSEAMRAVCGRQAHAAHCPACRAHCPHSPHRARCLLSSNTQALRPHAGAPRSCGSSTQRCERILTPTWLSSVAAFQGSRRRICSPRQVGLRQQVAATNARRQGKPVAAAL
jgi:hypothetical protein